MAKGQESVTPEYRGQNEKRKPAKKINHNETRKPVMFEVNQHVMAQLKLRE